MNTDAKPSVLILCTGNSCRSHMAEGILRNAAGDLFEVHSAGSNPAGFVHPLATKALSEMGIDISTHASKHMNEFLDQRIQFPHRTAPHGLIPRVRLQKSIGS